ncbi:MAG: IS1380 family transposase [Candidatus Fermentibacteraceae bacterium]|nr:IS1380 family transposase [Candidatus Fermentibacteraceae bacterium]
MKTAFPSSATAIVDLLCHRIFGIALGYEDLNDHDELRTDPGYAAIVGKSDPTGSDRSRDRDRGYALAGSSTLNRFELGSEDGSASNRYRKIVGEFSEIEELITELSLEQMALEGTPPMIFIDADATDDPLHGRQEGRFFHGYYDSYCYLPLYIFSGDYLLCAKLIPSKIDACDGVIEELKRIIPRIREKLPGVKIVFLGDSGFCREEILSWLQDEAHIDYVIDMAKNNRLLKKISAELEEAEKIYDEEGKPCRIFKGFYYMTRNSWSRYRRVIGKAEHLEKGSNPRFVLTSLVMPEYSPEMIYEELYCARGEMENRIKEQQLCLFADRTSTHWLSSNQLRVWLSGIAYILLNAMRSFALKGTEMARARCDSIRLKLFKIGALVRVSVRRVYLTMSSSYPYKTIFEMAYLNLQKIRV